MEIRLPPLGETVEHATLTNWHKSAGEWVALDEPLYEVETDKVVTDVPSPGEGYLVSVAAQVGDELPIGAVIAILGSTPDASQTDASPADSSERQVEVVEAPPSPSAGEADAPPANGQVSRVRGPRLPRSPDPRVMSPVVRRLIAQHGLDPAEIKGRGHGGRITRADVESAISVLGSTASPAAAPPIGPAVQSGELVQDPDDERMPFTTIRRITAEHIGRSKATSAHTLTIVAVDYERIARLRRSVAAEFKQRHGVTLTYLPFIIRSTVEALRAFPRVNASVGTDELVVHQRVDLGVAVALGMDGLVVPVLRRVDEMRLPAIAAALHDVAERARSRRLSADELKGGSFTITNPGGYGTFAGAAIINQPQVAILNTDGIAKEAVVVERPGEPDSLAIHHVGRLSLSWDHRAIDGLYAAAFLDEVRNQLQSRDWTQEL